MERYPSAIPCPRTPIPLGRSTRVRKQKVELPHVPRRRRAALGAQAAVQADVLVLHHDALGLRQRVGHVERLRLG